MKTLNKSDAKLKLVGLGEHSIKKNYYGELMEKARELEEKNRQLEQEIKQRVEAQTALIALNEDLERKVEQRTHDLDEANAELLHSLEELRLTQNYILQTEKMDALGLLMTGLAHELNTPLGNGLMGTSYQLELLKSFSEKLALDQDASPQAVKDFIEDLKEATEVVSRNLNLSAQLVTNFKTIIEDQGHLEYKYFDIRRYTQMVIASMGRDIKRLGVDVILMDSNVPLYLEERPGLLSQILTALLDNALSHGLAGVSDPEIFLKYTKSPSGIWLTFKDNGIGISEDVKRKVFEPFYSTKQGRTHKGMGLFRVYQLVTEHLKGTIYLDSTLGKGTEVQIHLPSKEEPSSEK